MTGENQLPEFEVARSASAGVNNKAIHLKDLQLNPNDLERFPGVSDGDFLKVIADHDHEKLQVYARVQERDHTFSSTLEDGEVGLGLPIREAIAVNPDFNDTVTVDTVSFGKIGVVRRFFNYILGYRPVTVRVRRAVYPDPGQKVIRIPEEVKHIAGIEWGDRVVLQSSEGRVREIKAFPLTPQQQEKVNRRESDPETHYPPPFVDTELGKRTGTKTDIPRVHLSASVRDDLGLANYGERNGVYQPLKIHRDTWDLFFRLADTLTIPFLLGALAVVVGIQIPLFLKISILFAAMFLVVVSVIFQSRRVLLE